MRRGWLRRWWRSRLKRSRIVRVLWSCRPQCVRLHLLTFSRKAGLAIRQSAWTPTARDYPSALRRRRDDVPRWSFMSNNVRWFALGFALVGCATHAGDDQTDPTSPPHLEVVIDTPTLHWADGVAETSSVHAIRVDDTDGTRTDVTDQAAFAVAPVELGGVAASTLAPSGQMAGAGQLTATLSTLLGEGDFEVFISDTVPG